MALLPRSLIRRKGEVAVWRIRNEGARATASGHPAITWISGIFFDPDCFDCDCFVCDSNIEIIRERVSTREEEVAGTRVTKQVVTFFTWAPIRKYDRIDYNGVTYEVESVEYPVYLHSVRSYQRATMVEVGYYGIV